MLNVSKIFCSAALCVTLGTVTAAAGNGSTTNKGSTPNGKPFLHINGELSQLSETVASLQDQVTALVNSVSTLQEKQSILEDALIKAENDIEANAELIAMLKAELAAIKDVIDVQNDIATGTCPDGQAVVAVTENSITCSGVNQAETVPEYYYVYTAALIPADPNTSLHKVQMTCELNDMVINSGYYYQNYNLHITGSQPLAGHTGNGYQTGWQYAFANPTNRMQVTNLWMTCKKLEDLKIIPRP